MYHVVICREAYHGPYDAKLGVVFKKGAVYQAENHGKVFRVWRNKRSFLKFSPERFTKFFKIFC